MLCDVKVGHGKLFEATIEAVKKARQVEVESWRLGEMVMARRNGAATQQFAADE